MTGTFYASGAGDALVEPGRYPPAVRAFLAEEEAYIARTLRSFDVLVEVGSMDGLHLDLARRMGKSYLGIDPVERYVAAGRLRGAQVATPGAARFIVGCSEELPRIMGLAEAIALGSPLVVFPFNSVGNMASLEAVATALVTAGAAFSLMTYATTVAATTAREAYYCACNYPGLARLDDPRGVRFCSPSGLDTIAYHSEVVRHAFCAIGCDLVVGSTGEIGVVYEGLHARSAKPERRPARQPST
jgi:hypothetical protein